MFGKLEHPKTFSEMIYQIELQHRISHSMLELAIYLLARLEFGKLHHTTGKALRVGQVRLDHFLLYVCASSQLCHFIGVLLGRKSYGVYHSFSRIQRRLCILLPNLIGCS